VLHLPSSGGAAPMKDSNLRPRLLRFGVFEVDLRTGELCKQGLRVKLPGQPFQLLAMLLEHPGELVSREEIREKLWPGDTFLDFEHSVNNTVKKLREALGDDPVAPRFIETLPRHGYRFIAPVDVRAVPELPLPKRWMVGVIGGVVLAIVVVLFALEVAGLRDRLLRHTLPVPKIESLAVLPLENLSGDPQQEYFADGMTEELITNLGKISALRVISRTSVMRYKGTKKPLAEIAKELNVDAVVEGTVLRSGDRVRVTANLLDARADRHLWSETYDRDLGDVLMLQDEVARAIANEIQTKVTPQEHARLATARPVDPEAHELYLKGNDSLSRDDLYRALECFEQTVTKDPNFARGYLGLAQTYADLGNHVLLPSVEAYRKAKTYAQKALELDGSLSEAHAQLGNVLWQGDWDWSGAERELKRALEINPNSEGAREMYSWYLYTVGRTEEAVAEAKRAVEINPLSGDAYNGLAHAYFYERRYDDALAQVRRARELNPNQPSWEIFPWTYVEKGMYEQAYPEFLKWPGCLSVPGCSGHLGNAYARAGQKAEAQRILRKLIEQSKQGIGTYEVAMIYTALGEKDRALEWLERAYKVHDKGLCWLKIDFTFDPLRSDPRFQALLRRMNFPP
jgi:TolB-like protein/DNA-binding winged helix-turn-helix (wHTH) protein/Tfp pilus assembly protein PilF